MDDVLHQTLQLTDPRTLNIFLPVSNYFCCLKTFVKLMYLVNNIICRVIVFFSGHDTIRLQSENVDLTLLFRFDCALFITYCT